MLLVQLFLVATEAFCGNGIKEGNEECDCGNMCGQDNCCRDNCTLTPGSQCRYVWELSWSAVQCDDVCSSSSTVEPCCNTTCRYQPDTFQCMSQTECGEASFCMYPITPYLVSVARIHVSSVLYLDLCAQGY